MKKLANLYAERVLQKEEERRRTAAAARSQKDSLVRSKFSAALFQFEQSPPLEKARYSEAMKTLKAITDAYARGDYQMIDTHMKNIFYRVPYIEKLVSATGNVKVQVNPVAVKDPAKEPNT